MNGRLYFCLRVVMSGVVGNTLDSVHCLSALTIIDIL
jgi:hypothetical protein